ncbi:MAG: hypothetical protein ACK559_27865, partial [bacterium]
MRGGVFLVAEVDHVARLEAGFFGVVVAHGFAGTFGAGFLLHGLDEVFDARARSQGRLRWIAQGLEVVSDASGDCDGDYAAGDSSNGCGLAFLITLGG